MAAAEGQQSPPQSQQQTWHDIVLRTLKRNDIKLVPYVPDRVLTTQTSGFATLANALASLAIP